ncbi:MAG: Asp-tRNA(Asn)/Glu-tRNA(Gln) amidotransferase subunit GatB [Bacteroidota bacterium]|nr:Asp-tRNA(Asn)/Glu-tRNA(Gln) amidotransferase subunit GatB [Bacteroidota bacterium]
MSMRTVIGLEIHAQLRTRSKAFCGCSAEEGGEPNTRTCPVCLGHPGALPVLNAAMPRATVLLGRATGCRIRPQTTFSRKHYFYPDLVKGYQITQHRDPICEDGTLPYVDADGRDTAVRITRIHMEEDAARMKHTAEATLVDYNRAGVPLLEIVTAPDFSRPADAAAFMRAMRQLLRWLDLCDGDMERGSLRCDANISLQREDGSAGARSEIKNLNSFRGVERALAWEEARQRSCAMEGTPIETGTLLWDDDVRETRPMRGKESATEYHYLPEPDLPPVIVTGEMIADADRALPELPWQRRKRFVSTCGLSAEDSALLTAERGMADYFEDVLHLLGGEEAAAQEAANWISGEILREMHAHRRPQPGITAARLVELLRCVRDGVVSTSAAKEILPVLHDNPAPVEEIVDAMGLRQLRDDAALRAMIDDVLRAHPAQLREYLGGKQKLFAFFMGQVMRRSGGAADPNLLRRLLTVALDEAAAAGDAAAGDAADGGPA